MEIWDLEPAEVKEKVEVVEEKRPIIGGFQLLDLIITELKSHMTW